MITLTKKGGKRQNAGRKPIKDRGETKRQLTVYWLEKHIERLGLDKCREIAENAIKETYLLCE
jgi:hypothetical protein